LILRLRRIRSHVKTCEVRLQQQYRAKLDNEQYQEARVSRADMALS
jgi:hypothetical protein